MIDPGGDADLILQRVQAHGLTIVALIHTHAHLDHFLASGDLKEKTGAPIHLHKEDKFLVGCAGNSVQNVRRTLQAGTRPRCLAERRRSPAMLQRRCHAHTRPQPWFHELLVWLMKNCWWRGILCFAAPLVEPTCGGAITERLKNPFVPVYTLWTKRPLW